nr:MAG TPA: hypothetical protein [Caudoviricetes sp.]
MDVFGQVAAKRREIEEATKMNIAKSFQENISTTTEVEEEKVEKSMNDELDEVHRELFGDTLGEIEKAVYADTPQNRKLGRVGQEYHRGKGKKDDRKKNKSSNTGDSVYGEVIDKYLFNTFKKSPDDALKQMIDDPTTTDRERKVFKKILDDRKEVKSNNLDFDTKTLLTHYVNRQSFPLVRAKMGQELDGHKIGEKNNKNEFWMPKKEYNEKPHHSGHWVSKQELEDFENKAMGGVLKEKHYKSMPIGKEFKDDNGNAWKVVKHLPDYDNGNGGGRIRLKTTNKDGKSKTLGVDVSTIKAIKRSKNLTTGVSSLDKYIRDNF